MEVDGLWGSEVPGNEVQAAVASDLYLAASFAEQWTARIELILTAKADTPTAINNLHQHRRSLGGLSPCPATEGGLANDKHVHRNLSLTRAISIRDASVCMPAETNAVIRGDSRLTDRIQAQLPLLSGDRREGAPMRISNYDETYYNQIESLPTNSQRWDAPSSRVLQAAQAQLNTEHTRPETRPTPLDKHTWANKM